MKEVKLRKIMSQIKSSDPEKRYNGLDELAYLKGDESLEVQVDVLVDIVKLASRDFPEPVDKWDIPSYYLIDFACDFLMQEVIEAVLKYFDGFHPFAKERAISFLLLTEDDKVIYELENILQLVLKTEELTLPVEELAQYPVLVKNLLAKNMNLFKSVHYKDTFFQLLLSLNESGIDQGFKKAELIPILVEEYRNKREAFLPYNNEYKTEFVYKAWKERYHTLRNELRFLISLMSYYFTEETEKLLLEATQFHDPLIKSEAILVCIDKNIPIEKSMMVNVAKHIESAEMIYFELKDANKEHLYPILENKQALLAKTKMFYHILNIEDEESHTTKYTEEITVIDKVDTENSYGQPVRYYLVKFIESDISYIGWVGAYSLEDGEDSAYSWEGTYTEFVEFDSLTIEEHKQAFFKNRNDDQKELEQSLFYVSHRKISKGLWFFYGIVVLRWIQLLFEGISKENLYVPLVATIIALIGTLIEKNLNKNSWIAIGGFDLLFKKRKKESTLPLVNIKKVVKSNRFIFIYNKADELEMKIPMSWVRYEHFTHYLREQTNHLKDAPFIED
ncbi:hypothetical protein JOC75_000844 [Metabacillus crassostreae]|uniref:hypothetical protein n=1 Tax=Metabacillus crassostreae TaxID=929098 RepID=UPI001958D0C8|nr:hypothetical protein [Metabacillus crassostreae]MBM7602874.1 hypothetical protein [Metabacillus crassostreae]